MNTCHHIVFFRFALLLLALVTSAVSAQAPSDGTFLPEGIEATGDTAEVRALTAWAGEHRHSDPEQAERAARRALALARELDDRHGIARSLKSLGNFAADPEQAEAHFTEARAIFEELGDERGLVGIRLDMGAMYSRRGDLEQSLAAYFDALEGYERLGDTEGRARVLGNIGIVYKQEGQLREAQRYYEQAVTLSETVDDPILLANNLNNLAGLFIEQGAYESAEIHLRRVLGIFEEEGAQYQTAVVYYNLGYVFNEQGRYEQALSYLRAAERLATGMRDIEGRLIFELYDELAESYMGLGRNADALRAANKSLEVAEETGGDPRFVMVIHETLSQIYRATGDLDQALVHYEAYMAAKDSVFNAERAAIVSEMLTRYETEEKERAIERFEQENKIQALQLTLLLGGIVLALLVAGFFYYRYRVKRKAHRLLAELDDAKSRFFANVSHEFRTPLTVILGELQDALSGRFGALPPKLTGRCRAILRNTRQLQGLIDEVLDMGRLEAGKLELQAAPGDLVRSLRRIVEADTPLAERNGIDLTFEPDAETCPRLYDQEKLEKVVGNLLSNALKFTPKGGSVCVSLNGEKETTITVADDGPGIPTEMQEKIFERFAQVEDGAFHGGLSAVLGTAQAGTGIGLALAKELAELHGGTITLESTPGEGSTFTVRLPLEKATLEQAEPVPEEEFAIGGDGHEERQDGVVSPNGDVGATLVVAQQTEETDGDPDVSRRSVAETDRTTVLVIEDNDDVRAYVRRSLEETYRVLEAAEGETGLQQAREALPDLVVSDVMLPGIDGYEIVRRLKVEPATECIPVVMLTARAAEEDKTEGYGSGAEVYITKPFSPETLRAACARLLEERHRLRRRLQEAGGQTEGTDRENGEPSLADRARAVVFENLHDEAFGVEELASALGMSLRTLQHNFKTEGELPPSDFVRTRRLERARELLRDGAGSVSEVAYAVGFNSLSVFSRNYRAHYGVPPSEHLGREKKASG